MADELRRFPPPGAQHRRPRTVIRDANGQALLKSTRETAKPTRGKRKAPTNDEARWVAVNVAWPPELLERVSATEPGRSENSSPHSRPADSLLNRDHRRSR